MWLVCTLRLWEEQEFKNDLLPFPTKVKRPEYGEIGFCPVFGDYQKALAYSGNPELLLEIILKGETDERE